MKNKFHFILIQLIIILISVFLLSTMNDLKQSEWLDYAGTLILFSSIIQIYFFLKISSLRYKLTLLFLILANLFTFSQLYLLSISFEFPISTSRLSIMIYGFRNYVNSTFVSFLFFSSLVFFASFFSRTKRNINKVKNKIFDMKYNLFNLGLFLFFISFPIDLFGFFIPQISAASSGIYQDVLNIESNYILYIISIFVLPSILLIISSKKLSKNTKRLILISYLVYKIFYLFTGLRAYNLMQIIICLYYLYALYKSEFKITLKKMLPRIIILILAIPIVFFLVILIREGRNQGFSQELFYEVLNNFNSIIFNLLSEFGLTSNIITHVITNTIQSTQGSQITSAFASIIPFISNIFPNIDWINMTIAERFDVWNLGGSFIADFYFDFGFYGFLWLIFYAYFIIKVEDKFNVGIKTKNYLYSIFFIPLIIEILFTARSTIQKIPRFGVWYFIIFIIFVSIYKIFKRAKVQV